MKNLLRPIKLLAAVFSIVLLSSSCEKDVSNEYPFRVRVVSPDGIPLANISVRATADVPNAIPDFRGSTNIEGYVNFKYDNKAVLKVQASRGNPITWIGCAFVRLEEGTEITKTIVLQPYDPSVGGC